MKSVSLHGIIDLYNERFIMSCGIYLLQFTGTHKIYIGKSLNIEDRYMQHLRVMRKGTEPKKLQQAYNIYGEPTLEVLFICSSLDLAEQENASILKYNAVDEGFNSLRNSGDMPCFYGEEHPGALYTNIQIEQAFLLLVYGSLTHQQIADTSKVSKGIVNHIAIGSCHGWLRDKYPEDYALLLSRVQRGSTSKERGTVLPTLVSPEGVEYPEIPNIRAFGREHDIPYSSLNSLLKLRTDSVRGWVRK